MSGKIIASDCAARGIFLRNERQARLAIEAAERTSDFPWHEIGAFLAYQGARLEHEERCPTCRATKLEVA